MTEVERLHRMLDDAHARIRGLEFHVRHLRAQLDPLIRQEARLYAARPPAPLLICNCQKDRDAFKAIWPADGPLDRALVDQPGLNGQATLDFLQRGEGDRWSSTAERCLLSPGAPAKEQEGDQLMRGFFEIDHNTRCVMAEFRGDYKNGLRNMVNE